MVDLVCPEALDPPPERLASLRAALGAEASWAAVSGGGQLGWRRAGRHLLVDLHFELTEALVSPEPSRVAALVQGAFGGALHELRAVLRGRG
jgi:hypothetical protein